MMMGKPWPPDPIRSALYTVSKSRRARFRFVEILVFVLVFVILAFFAENEKKGCL